MHLSPESLDLAFVEERQGEMSGLVNPQGESVDISPSSDPLELSQGFVPWYVGSVHAEFFSDIRLASPLIFGTWANIECRSSDVRLNVGSDVMSRWVHWYADWEPATYQGLDSYIGSLTTVSKRGLKRLRGMRGLETSWLVRVRLATKPETYLKPKIDEESFWI